MKLTAEQIQEIRGRCEAATAGEWRVQDRGSYLEIHDNHTWGKALSPFAKVEGDEFYNAEFIAHARQDVPALLDHITQLEAELAELREAERWIPVEERLPPDGNYLAIINHGYYGQRIGILSYSNDRGKVEEYEMQGEGAGFFDYDSEVGFYSLDTVTHWRPIPKLPEGGGGE